MPKSKARRRKQVTTKTPAAKTHSPDLRVIDENTLRKHEANKLYASGHRQLERGNARKAVRNFIAAYRLDHENVDGLKVMAHGLVKLGRRHMAIEILEQAVALAPDDGEIYFELGNIALSMSMMETAAKFFAVVVEKCPEQAMGYNNLATALRELDRPEDAIQVLQQAIPRFPTLPLLWNTLATAVQHRDGLEAALEFYQEALRCDPKMGMTLSNIAKAYEDLGDYETAIKYAGRCIRADKKLAEPHLVRAHALLALGDLEQGWPEYEYRLDPSRRGATVYVHDLPRWHGEDLSGRSLLIYPEQGIGDELLFAAVFDDIIAHAGTVLIGCDRRLVPLFERSFPEAIVGAYEDIWSDGTRHRKLPFVHDHPAPDYAIEAGSLMQYFRRSRADFPERQGYLKADPERVSFWRERLAAFGGGPKVGIFWRSGYRSHARDFHYTEITMWEPLLRIAGVDFVNLQYGDCANELAEAEALSGRKIAVWDDIDLRNNIDDAMALTAALDLVIGPASAPGMMAMALGAPWWSLLRRRPYWMFGTDHVPGAPATTCKLVPDGESWPTLIDVVARDLENWVRNRA